MLESGATAFHFGAPMNLPEALAKVSPDIVLCGNLDPSAVFCQAKPEEMRERAGALLAASAAHRNFVLSSGCDVPPGASLANLDAFYQSVRA
jgi:uroporphyrinogen decarboxylase